jgi:hypothetical protein
MKAEAGASNFEAKVKLKPAGSADNCQLRGIGACRNFQNLLKCREIKNPMAQSELRDF